MLRERIELTYSTTGKATLQLEKNEELVTTHLSKLNVNNLSIENFPPALVEKEEAILAEIPGQRQPQGPALADTRTRWEEKDYVVNVLYDGCVPPMLSLVSH